MRVRMQIRNQIDFIEDKSHDIDNNDERDDDFQNLSVDLHPGIENTFPPV